MDMVLRELVVEKTSDAVLLQEMSSEDVRVLAQALEEECQQRSEPSLHVHASGSPKAGALDGK